MSASRIERGCAVSAADYADMLRERARLVRAMDARLAALDALVMPTTSIVAPTIAEVADPKVFAARNAAVLRNTSIINFFDLCADLAAAAGYGAAGRAHAGRAQRPRPPAVAHCRGGERSFFSAHRAVACRRGRSGSLAFRHERRKAFRGGIAMTARPHIAQSPSSARRRRRHRRHFRRARHRCAPRAAA